MKSLIEITDVYDRKQVETMIKALDGLYMNLIHYMSHRLRDKIQHIAIEK